MARRKGPPVALCGAGMISGAHAMAARFLGLPVVAVASRTPESATKRASELRARVVRYDEMPAGAEIVVVSTPPPLHAEHALAALTAGAAVLLEKPITTTLADADRLVAAAEAHGQRLLYGENLAYAPAVGVMLGRVRTLGALTHLEVRAVNPRPTWGDFLTAEWGGGALFDLGVHPLAVALLLAAPARPVAVEARLEGGHDHPTDEHAEVTVTFDTGLRGRVVASWRGGPVSVWDAQVAGPAGVVRAELLPNPIVEHDGRELPLPVPTGDVPQIEQYGYAAQLRALVDDVATGRRPLMDAEFGRLVLEVVCAAYTSAGNQGANQPMPFNGPRDRTPLQLWRG
ncbi:MAG TPA: Gfo/Idh/MocA family oxidoreductase [Acidimicrobiales bacterium]